MKIKFGAIIVAGSGKIGGHVAAHNRSGAYMRTKVTPINSQTGSQTTVRNRLSTLATSWKALTAAQILAWNNAVSLYKGTNIFGDIKSPSGFNLYQKLNNNLSRIGVAALTTPPTPVALPSCDTGVLTSVHAGAMLLTFTNDPSMVASVVAVEATAPQSAGKSFIKSEYRYIGLLPTITAHVSTLTTIYNAKFGAPSTAGQKVYVRIRQISNVTGQAGIPIVSSAVVS